MQVNESAKFIKGRKIWGKISPAQTSSVRGLEILEILAGSLTDEGGLQLLWKLN